MQNSDHSYRYSNDGGNYQSYYQGSTDSRGYKSEDGRKITNTTEHSNNIYAQTYHHRTSHTSTKSDFTKTSKSTTNSQTQRKSLEQQVTSTVSTTGPPTIALFGVGSKTSIYFLRHALEAGYHVRAMIIHQSALDTNASVEYQSTIYPRDEQVHALAKQIRDEFSAQESSGTLHWIRADYIYDKNAMRRTVRNAQFVVCMMQDSAPLSSYGITPFDDGTSKSLKKRHPPHLPSMILPMDPKLCPDPTKPLTSFIQLLYPIMKLETSIKVFLYQANSIASDVKGKTPIFSKALKTLSSARSLFPAGRQNVCVNFTNSTLHSDHHSVIKEIAHHHRRCNYRSENRTSLGDISNGSNSLDTNNINGSRKSNSFPFHKSQENNGDVDIDPKNNTHLAKFAYIVTRPSTFLKDGRSMKKVSASKSQPGPFPIAHLDLAEFTLNALRNRKLYNSCPYIVTDSF